MVEKRGGSSTATGPKRFYKAADVRPSGTGGAFEVTLDGKPLRCPGGAAFAAPEAAARAAAAEWAAVAERIDPTAMPVTRAINTAIERIAPQRAAVIDEIAGYGGSDLLCYRAEAPAALAAREAAAWDPLLDWATERYGARLRRTLGVLPVAQPPEALAALRAAVASRCDLGLASLSELTALSGSLVIGLAAAEGRLDPEAAWAASRIDETWQAEQWGRDAEAAAREAAQRRDFEAAARLADLLRR